MSVLDELRKRLEHLAIPMRMIAMQNTGVERAVRESEMRDALNKFEADHPGLVDLTGWAVERYEETDPDGNRYQAIHSTRLTERTP